MPVPDPENLHRRFAELASAGDLEGVLSLYEEDATFVDPDGSPARGIAAIRERLRGLLTISPQIDPIDSRAVLAGDIALIVSRWRMSIDTTESDRTAFEASSTEVARRQPDGSWRYVIDDPASSTASRAPESPGAGSS